MEWRNTARMRAAWYLCVVPILLVLMSPISAARADVTCTAYASTYENSFGQSSQVNIYSSSGATSCNAAAPGQTFPGTEYRTVLLDNSPTQFPFSLTGLIVDQASATNGTLHAESSSAVDDTPESDFYTDQNGNPQSVPNPFPAGDWDTSTNAHYSDTLTAHNPTGAAVDLTFTLALDAPLSVSTCPTGRVLLPYPFSGYSAPEPLIDASSSAGFGISYGAGYELYSMEDACDPAADMSNLTIDLTIPDGTVFGITGYLQTDAFVSWGYQYDASYTPIYLQDVVATADASNTADFYVDVNTPGAYYTDGLGNVDSYLTPASGTPSVPEPLTLSVFGAGLAGLVAMRQRKTKA